MKCLLLNQIATVEGSPEKAGVGGSISSLATIRSRDLQSLSSIAVLSKQSFLSRSRNLKDLHDEIPTDPEPIPKDLSGISRGRTREIPMTKSGSPGPFRRSLVGVVPSRHVASLLLLQLGFYFIRSSDHRSPDSSAFIATRSHLRCCGGPGAARR